MEIDLIQKRLADLDLDGWLLYDHHGSNRFVRELLSLPAHLVITRRLFYFIPREGEPVLIAHRIEGDTLQSMPGRLESYLSLEDLKSRLASTLKGAHKVAMEYSKGGENPYISVIDGGTLELVNQFVEVVSSDNLLQHFTSVLNEKQMQLHREAAEILDMIASKCWELLRQRLRGDQTITEYDLQKFILSEFAAQNCVTEDGPTCSVNAHSALPHYMARKKEAAEIHSGDFILIDLWCRCDQMEAVYADITRVAVAAAEPTPKQAELFEIVRLAQKEAFSFLEKRLKEGKKVQGFEVDQACRRVIEESGYGLYFTHRTGHNIDTSVHGSGAHLDSLETRDQREILPCTCFSIEPGIYLPGEFGVRLEHDVLIQSDGTPLITGGVQESVVSLL